MWKGAIEKGKWGLDLELVGDKDVLDTIVKELAKREGVKVQGIELCAGCMDADSEEGEYTKMETEV